MTDQLSLYNGALRIIEERKLANISENRETARLLNDVWDDGAVIACLEQGLWLFAMKSARIDYTSSVEPPFGYRYAFSKPDDYIRTAALAADEYFRVPLNQSQDEAGFWFSDTTPIYVRYVSSGTSYGLDLSRWPQSFVQFVQAYHAKQIVGRVTKSRTITAKAEKAYDDSLLDARSKDCMNDSTKFMPTGSWAASRAGRQTGRRSMWNGTTTTT